MVDTTVGYCALEPGKPVVLADVSLPEWREDFVEIETTHSGVCHSDTAHLDNEWGFTVHPVCPGHETVGVVTRVGKDVKRLKVGDRVGASYQLSNCNACRCCVKGWDSQCLDKLGAFAGPLVDNKPTGGGFARVMRVQEAWAFKIPEGLSSEVAAPLLCAGITMFAPLRRFLQGPGVRVGILGLGGLGHVGVAMARAMGAEVTVLTGSESKVELAKEYGAHKVVLTSDQLQVNRAKGSLDLLLNTVPKAVDGTQLEFLDIRGRFVQIGIFTDVPLPVSCPTVVFNELELIGSHMGGRLDYTAMLNFCALHNIATSVKAHTVTNADELNVVLDNTRHGRLGHRNVLVYKWE